MLLMDIPGFLLGHRESGHLYFSEEHFQIHVWRKELKLQGLAWKLKNLLFMSLGTMHSLFWVLWCAGRVLSKPPCFGGSSDTPLAFSLLKSFPNPRSVNTAWDVCPILSSYLFLVNMRRSSREGFEHAPHPTPLLSFHSPFISGAKLITLPMRKAFHVLQRGWLEEVDSSLVSRKRSISFFINISE